jgi:hypothetical protein
MAQELNVDGGFSVIEASEAQLGPIGPRVVLGPLRFANHDCKQPTCQVSTSLFDTGEQLIYSKHSFDKFRALMHAS